MRKNTIPMGVYVDCDSVLHRINPAIKFCALIAFIIFTSFFVQNITLALALVAVLALAYCIAGIPWKIAFGQLWPPLIVLIPLTAFQWWQQDIYAATLTFLTIYAALIAAILLTLTTTVAEMMESLESALGPLERFGLPVEIISLSMSLTIRLIPLMLATVTEVLDARRARGAGFSVAAFGTPVLIRSIRRARAMGEALAARGVGD